jgi:hypothetical protein
VAILQNADWPIYVKELTWNGKTLLKKDINLNFIKKITWPNPTRTYKKWYLKKIQV